MTRVDTYKPIYSAILGGGTAVATHIESLRTSITIANTIETIYFACIGAAAGLLVHFFGKKLLNKIFKQ